MVITIPTEQKESERQDEQQKLFRDEDTGAVTSQEATSKETVYVAALERSWRTGFLMLQVQERSRLSLH